MSLIIPERWERIQSISLQAGSHTPSDGAMCVMEATAYAVGEPWSAAPQCVCPSIIGLMMSWNDSLLTSADRDRLLKPLIPTVVGTRSTVDVRRRRAMMAGDWLVRVYTPTWLRAAKLDAQAVALEMLPEIGDVEQYSSRMPTFKTVRTDAIAAWGAVSNRIGVDTWETIDDTARVGLRASGWDAVRAAARDAERVILDSDGGSLALTPSPAMSAAFTIWNSAWGIVCANACVSSLAPTRFAAAAAARDALAPIVSHLQDSAVDLVRRMCAVDPSALTTKEDVTG